MLAGRRNWPLGETATSMGSGALAVFRPGSASASLEPLLGLAKGRGVLAGVSKQVSKDCSGQGLRQASAAAAREAIFQKPDKKTA